MQLFTSVLKFLRPLANQTSTITYNTLRAATPFMSEFHYDAMIKNPICQVIYNPKATEEDIKNVAKKIKKLELEPPIILHLWRLSQAIDQEQKSLAYITPEGEGKITHPALYKALLFIRSLPPQKIEEVKKENHELWLKLRTERLTPCPQSDNAYRP